MTHPLLSVGSRLSLDAELSAADGLPQYSAHALLQVVSLCVGLEFRYFLKLNHLCVCAISLLSMYDLKAQFIFVDAICPC